MSPAPASDGTVVDACEACRQRSWLLGALSGRLDTVRAHILDVLALDDAELLSALGIDSVTSLEPPAGLASPGGPLGSGVSAVCRCSGRYPERLRDLAAPPAVVYLAGAPDVVLGALAGDVVAVVGARRATSYGCRVAGRLGSALASVGVTVVSGMALGIDAAAHRGALGGGGPEVPAFDELGFMDSGDPVDEPAVIGGGGRAVDAAAAIGPAGRAVDAAAAIGPAGRAVDAAAAIGPAGRAAPRAPTVAVLPGPPGEPYPPSHRALCARIVARGGVLSELPPGAPVRRWTFPARNRLIAALATMTVVVEAAERSGSLVTARVARELGRPVGAVPGKVTARTARGTNGLLADGARLVRGPGDVLEALFGPDRARHGLLEPPPLPPPLQALLDALSDGEDTARAIAAAGLDPAAGVAGLAELELSGRVRRAAGGFEVVR